MKKTNLSKNSKILMLIDMCYSISGIFLSTFLVAYFLKITNESIVQISIFYIITYALLGIGNVLLGKLVKIKKQYRTKILSIAAILKALFILLIAVLKENIATHFIAIAVLYAISETAYWVVHENIYVEVTTNNNRKDYMAIKTILGKLVNIIIPIFLGASIELYSFSKIAIYVLFISIIQIIASLQIKINTKEEKTEYGILKFVKSLNKKQKKKINTYVKSAIAYGVVESSMKTLVVIITIMTFKTSFDLGILTSIFAICSMIAIYLYKKYYNKNNSKLILYSCSTLILISIIGLIFDINKVTLIIYNFLYTTAVAILSVVYDTKKGNLIEECNIEQWKTEYLIYVDLFLSAGRVTGYILMLIAGLFNNIIIFKGLLIIVVLFAPIYTRLLNKVDNTY